METEEELEFYTTQKIADIFEVKPDAVRDWIKSGELKALNLNGSYRVSKGDLKEFIASRYGGDTP